MIAWFTAIVSVPILMMLWSITYFGIMPTICIMALVIAALIFGAAFIVTHTRGIVSNRQYGEHF